jgi:hypothetical protein
MMLLFQCAKINKVSRIQEVKVVIYFKREKKAEKGKDGGSERTGCNVQGGTLQHIDMLADEEGERMGKTTHRPSC